jgi:hypothetical protein
VGTLPWIFKNWNTSWWIGSGGLIGKNGTENSVRDYAFHTRGNKDAKYPITVNIAATDDFPIDANLSFGGQSTLNFNTTDPESGDDSLLTKN